jgi:hypothetical protein
MTVAAANVEILRRGWNDAVSALAPNVDELPALLGARLDEAVRDDRLSEQALLAVVEEAAHVAMAAMPPAAAGNLARRLQRAVYEYLLSLDAMTPEETEPAAVEQPPAAAAKLIGAEEVAALSGHPADPVLRVMQPFELPAAAAQPPAQPQLDPAPEPLPAAGMAAAPDTATPPETAGPPPAEPAASSGSEPAGESGEEGDYEARRPRFTLFRRVAPTPADEPPDIPAPVGYTAPAPPPGPAGIRFEEPAPVHAEEETAVHEMPQVPAQPAVQAFEPSAPAEPAPFVAPRDGFHLSDIGDLTRPQGVPETGTSRAPEESSRADAEPSDGERGWHVRDARPERYTRRRPVTTVLNAPGQPEPEDTPEQDAETQNRFDFEPAIVELRQQIRDRLQRRKLDEAAALLQKLATELGGRAVAELALDAGDRCRALGKSNAALSCYLAATRADPVYEAPLLRLADICLDDQDIELAASYLERVARLLRMRGDDKGALRIYRKLATIAPFREDIISVLMRAQTSGRFDE